MLHASLLYLVRTRLVASDQELFVLWCYLHRACLHAGKVRHEHMFAEWCVSDTRRGETDRERGRGDGWYYSWWTGACLVQRLVVWTTSMLTLRVDVLGTIQHHDTRAVMTGRCNHASGNTAEKEATA